MEDKELKIKRKIKVLKKKIYKMMNDIIRIKDQINKLNQKLK